MMPLSLVEPGEENQVHKIGGEAEMKKHLENLGFVAGATVTVITVLGSSLIVGVKETRVALSREMAGRILVSGAST